MLLSILAAKLHKKSVSTNEMKGKCCKMPQIGIIKQSARLYLANEKRQTLDLASSSSNARAHPVMVLPVVNTSSMRDRKSVV